jgi:hypothetical protein
VLVGVGRGVAGTHQLLRHPLGALGEELEVGIGVNVEDVDELGLEKGADVHPFLVHLLHSATGGETKTMDQLFHKA